MIIEVLIYLGAFIVGAHIGIIGMGITYYRGYSIHVFPLIVSIGLAFQLYVWETNLKIVTIYLGILIAIMVMQLVKDKFVIELQEQLLEKGVY